jgi:hypothetical protein
MRDLSVEQGNYLFVTSGPDHRPKVTFFLSHCPGGNSMMESPTPSWNKRVHRSRFLTPTCHPRFATTCPRSKAPCISPPSPTNCRNPSATKTDASWTLFLISSSNVPSTKLANVSVATWALLTCQRSPLPMALVSLATPGLGINSAIPVASGRISRGPTHSHFATGNALLPRHSSLASVSKFALVFGTSVCPLRWARGFRCLPDFAPNGLSSLHHLLTASTMLLVPTTRCTTPARLGNGLGTRYALSPSPTPPSS